MFRTLKKFFDFCGEKERKQFYLSIFLGVFNALFVAMRIPAARREGREMRCFLSF